MSLLNYTELDADQIKAQMIAYLRTTLGWANLTNDEVLDIIANMQSAISEQLIYLINRRAEETYISTARTLSAVMLNARAQGYIPRRKISATTRLRFSVAATETPVSGEVIATGNGADKTLTGTFANIPVKRGSISFTYNIAGISRVGQDDGSGNLVGDYIDSGTINYDDGSFSMVFDYPVTLAEDVVASYIRHISAHSEAIVIPQHTKVSSSGGINFITKEAVTITPDIVEVDVDAIQGTLQENVFVSDGTANQKFFFEMENPEEDYNFVLVNSIEWDIAETLIHSDPEDTDAVIEVANEYAGVNIYFGDNLTGLIPDISSDITVRILESAGKGGNIYATGDITNIDDTLYDAIGGEVTDISVTNTENAIGGTDEEGIEEIRANAPDLYKVGEHTLTTKQDWNDYVNAYPGVYRGNVWGEYENNEGYPNINEANNVNIAILLTDGQEMSESFKTTFKESLRTLKEINAHVVLYDVPKVLIRTTVTANILRTKNTEAIKSSIDTVVRENVSYINLNIGQALRKSPVTRAIEEIEGINYHYLLFEVIDEVEDGTGGSTYSGTTAISLIKSMSVSVIKRNVSGVDTVLGNETSAGILTGAGLVSGTINHATGEYGVITTAPIAVGETLIFKYEQDSVGDVVCSNNQIFDVEKVLTEITYG